MKIPYSWLRDYVKVTLSPEELAAKLTMAGLEVSELIHSDGETVLDLEITANRPDCLSVVGIAREVAALVKEEICFPDPKVAEEGEKIDSLTKIDVKDWESCPRYGARVITGVKIAPSPAWLVRRLEMGGLRAVNNVVDATNYVLLELGHPLHAFDFDKLAGRQIIVRWARTVESIVTIDGVERRLQNDMLVIADERKPVAVAGIMGGMDTEVRNDTKNLLLESAYFNPSVVRRTAKNLRLSTEASYRFERGIDQEGVLIALDRATQLIQELAGGKIARGAVDCYQGIRSVHEIQLRLKRINQILATTLSWEKVANILESLGFVLKGQREGEVTVSIPSFRRDVIREIDLIEEIARHYGYDNIPVSMPHVQVKTASRFDENISLEQIKNIIVGCGLTEVINYSLVSGEELEKLLGNMDDEWKKQLVRVRNPLTEEQVILRPTLLTGLLRNLAWNLNHGVKDICIFECGRIFISPDGNRKPEERMTLAALVSGRIVGDGWKQRQEEVDFFYLKGVVEKLWQFMNFTPYELKPVDLPEFHRGRVGKITFENGTVIIGRLGELHPRVRECYNIRQRAFAFELDLGVLSEYRKWQKSAVSPPKYPGVVRDVSIIAPGKISAGELEHFIREKGGDIVKEVTLFDVYQGQQIPAGQRSLSYSITYRSAKKTLTEEEVNQLHNNLLQSLIDHFQVKVRVQ